MSRFFMALIVGAVVGYIGGLLIAGPVFLLILVIAEIRWPDTRRRSSRPTRFNTYWVTKPGKESEENEKNKFLYMFFDPLMKWAPIICIIIAFIYFLINGVN